MERIEVLRKWFGANEKRFSLEKNGYLNPPVLTYISILPLIDVDASILDIGSGNGMLLKFIVEFSNHKITPYGIDVKKEAINEARHKIFPEYADNFVVGDIDEPINFRNKFDIIICNPFHSSKGIKNLNYRLKKIRRQNGKIILMVHDDLLSKNNIDSVKQMWDMANVDIKISRGAETTYGIITK